MKSHLSETLYLSSPIWIQNLLVSLYGVLEHDRRYGGNYKQLSQQLMADEFKDAHKLDAVVNKKLQAMLECATTNVPFYRNLNLQNADLDAFPVLNRASIANNPEDFLSDKYDPNKLIQLYTGGSTGTPLKVYISKEVRRKTYAFWNRFYQNIGFNIGDKKASFVGRKIQQPDNNKPPFWRYNAIDKQLIFSSFHMSESNLPLYIEKLNAFQPVLIEGYPLSVLRLADFILANNIKLQFTPLGISTSSENFSNEQRKTMQQAFNCKVFDQYGSAESVVFASECEFGRKHISVEYGLVEVLNDDGEILKEGEGELIVTTLLNDVMPLIRYRIGDLGKVSYKECQCGRHTPAIEELYGKVGAVIVTKNTKVPTAAIAIAFEYLENIRNAQIIQNEPDNVLVKLVPKPGFKPDEEKFMLWELQKMLGEEMEIKVEHVDQIPPGKNGKYQMVVQNHYTF
jgi:phenylacetate-CoA ligase